MQKVTISTLKRTLYKSVQSIANLRNIFYIFWYNIFLKDKIARKIRQKGRMTIIFPVINVGMWKSTKLFLLLQKDCRFSPFIVTAFVPGDTPEYMEYVQNEICDYFTTLGFPVIKTFDPISKQIIKLRDIKGDMFIYPQPYHNNYKELPSNALFSYIPYDYPIQDEKVFHNWLYHNICWRIFAVNDNYKEYEKRYSWSKGKNVSVVGYSNADYYFDNHLVKTDVWKLKDFRLKRIIWAPHHSILSSDTMGQSLFLILADSFLELTKKYESTCQFVFKPHPRLKDKLYQLKSWGIKRTNEYYNQWINGVNTNFVEGDYIDLFISSDALIHDCSSFIAEYLYSGHPVMFTVKDSYNYNLHGGDLEIFDALYKGKTIEDIDCFIKNVVIDGNDFKINDRKRVLLNELVCSNKYLVSEIIYKEISSLFE